MPPIKKSWIISTEKDKRESTLTYQSGFFWDNHVILVGEQRDFSE